MGSFGRLVVAGVLFFGSLAGAIHADLAKEKAEQTLAVEVPDLLKSFLSIAKARGLRMAIKKTDRLSTEHIADAILLISGPNRLAGALCAGAALSLVLVAARMVLPRRGSRAWKGTKLAVGVLLFAVLTVGANAVGSLAIRPVTQGIQKIRSGLVEIRNSPDWEGLRASDPALADRCETLIQRLEPIVGRVEVLASSSFREGLFACWMLAAIGAYAQYLFRLLREPR